MSEKIKTPLTPTSWGELLDKISILEIKATKLTNKNAVSNINNELVLLKKIKNELPQIDQYLTSLIKDLSNVNMSLWNIEDRLREKERQKVFDADFISLARSVYHQNDKRAKVKREINDYLGSELVEEKSYTPY